MARLNYRASVAGGASKEKEEKSFTTIVAINPLVIPSL